MPTDRYSDDQLRRMRAFADAGEALIQDRTLRDFLYGKVRVVRDEIEAELREREAERRTMFVPPLVQLLNLVRWNERRGWGFSEDDVSALMDGIPAEPAGLADGALQLAARVLEIHLPDGPDGAPGYLRTFDELWDVVVQEQGMRPCHVLGLDPKVRLALAPGAIHAPGLRWRIIDFGAGRGDAPRKTLAAAERPAAGILAAAAHFPLWLARMDGAHVPYAWLPGYELPGMPHAIGPSRDRIVHHPALSGDGYGKVFLYFHWDHVTFKDYAVPAYLDAPPLPAAEGDGFGG